MQVLAVKTRVKHFPEDSQGSVKPIAPPKPCKEDIDDSTSPGGRESLRRSMTREYGFGGDVKELTSTVKGERPSAHICKRDNRTFVCVGATSWKWLGVYGGCTRVGLAYEVEAGDEGEE
jgi:hypothetical protein